MLYTRRRELKDNIGDQLRGIRHLVRALGAEAPEIRVANQALPLLPPELNHLLGATFQTMDGVMGTLKTITAPFRPCRSSLAGFKRFEEYFSAGDVDEEALTEDIYSSLKLVSRYRDANSFVLKARVAEISKSLALTVNSEKWTGADLAECCATLYLLLVKSRPLAEKRSDDIENWKTYAVVALVFGLSLSGRLSSNEFANFVQGDALLVCTQRASVFLDAAKTSGRPGVLIKTLESMLRHLP